MSAAPEPTYADHENLAAEVDGPARSAGSGGTALATTGLLAGSFAVGFGLPRKARS